MSSNFQMKKVCEQCGEVFIAKTRCTRFCSHKCNSKNYKLSASKKKPPLPSSDAEIMDKEPALNISFVTSKDYITIKELAVLISISERSLFRLIKSDDFPKIKLGRRLFFNKQVVINYINNKVA